MSGLDSRSMPENRDPEGRYLPGTSGNPGGRRKALRGIEEMMDLEFRTVESTREVLTKLRGLAIAGDVQAMKLYFDRVLGPVRPRWEDEPDETDLSSLSDAELARIARRSR